MNRIAMLVLVLLATAAADGRAQGRELSLEANPIAGTLGYGWARSPDLTIGLSFGFGFPQFDRTLAPSDESFLDIAHVGAFIRSKPARSITLDGRLQVGVAELDGCSGCFPGVFTGASGGVFWGWRRVKIGPRIAAGVMRERGATDFVINLTPVSLLLTLER